MHNPATEEAFEIKQDVVDPTGATKNRGISMDRDLTKNALAHPQFRWRDRISTTDLYKAGSSLMLHYYCPKCSNMSTISGAKKEIRWTPGDNGGQLSISAFRCTWPDCGLSIQVDNNVAKEV